MRWAPVAAAGSVIVTLAGAALVVVNGGSFLGDFNLDLLIVGTLYAAVGGFILARVPGNWLGRVFLVAGWLWALELLLTQVAWYGLVTSPGSIPTASLANWLAVWIWIPGNSLLFSWTPLLFPDGRLPSQRWRPVAGLILFGVVAATVGSMLAVWPHRDSTIVLSGSFQPSGVPGFPGALASIGTAIGFLVAPFAAVAALIVRYRSSRGVVRQQMRWFTAAAVLAAVCAVGDQLLSSVWPGAAGLVSAPALAFLPIALAIAILRYRLYEIDRVISRTLSWALMSGVLLAVFAVVVICLQNLLQPLTHESTLAVAGSTLVVAALFQPLRRRVQRAVDRRFDRARYDGEKTAMAFATRLRDQVNLNGLQEDMGDTVRTALGPGSMEIWIRSRRVVR